MRKTLSFLTLAAAISATPAMAQVDVRAGARVDTGVAVGVDTGRTVEGVRGTLDRTVDRTDRAVNRTLDRDVRVATAADVRAGATVRDNRGHRVGTVQRVHGDSAVVVQGGRILHVPLASLYRSSSGLVTNLTREQIRAQARADARADAAVRN